MQQSNRDLLNLIRAGKPSGARLATAVVFCLLSALGLLWYPLLTRELIDALGSENGGTSNLVTGLAGLLVVVLVGASVIGAVGDYMLARIGHEIVARLRHSLIGTLLHLPVASFDEKETGDRVSRIIGDCQSVSNLATMQVVNFINGLVLLLGSVGVLIFLDPMLTLTMVITIVGAFAVVMPIAAKMQSLAKIIQDRTASLSGMLTHIFSEIRLVKAFNAESRERNRSHGLIDELKKLGFGEAKIFVSLQPITNLATTISLVVILTYGAGRVAQGTMSIGTLTAFILYIFNIVIPMIQLSGFITEFQRAKGASNRITTLFQERSEWAYAGEDEMPAGGALEFRNVSFAYEEGAGILHGLNLSFEQGVTTALVGHTGSGKTTTLSLIERFYAPTEGEIVYAGKPITEIDLSIWRRSIGYVSQSAPVMPGSIRDNIAYGMATDVSDQEVMAAAEKAQALSFIQDLPDGLDTKLIEQGNNLSGGQRQRIAIARMFLRDPDLLILDEATSSLDSETEYQVKTALEALMIGRTNIIVAHRLSSIVHAERIYYFQDGEISGSGTHEDLLQNHPDYARLVERQFHQDQRREPASIA